MKSLLLSCVLTVWSFSTYASPLNGHFDVTATSYGGQIYTYCLALQSQGPQGVYRDQGAAYILTPPGKKYAYAGQYRLFNHQLSIAVGNIELVPNTVFLKAHLDDAQFTEATFNLGFSGHSGTFVAVRRGEGCKQD